MISAEVLLERCRGDLREAWSSLNQARCSILTPVAPARSGAWRITSDVDRRTPARVVSCASRTRQTTARTGTGGRSSVLRFPRRKLDG